MLNRSSILEVFKRRLFSADDEAIGLDIADAEKARAQYRSYKEEGITGGPSLGQCYRRLRKRPLLLLYFIDPTTTTGEPWSGEPQTRPIVSVGLSFPQYNDSEGRGLIAYQTNQVWQQMRLDLENDTDEDELIESATVA
jgi:hypothetical protein